MDVPYFFQCKLLEINVIMAKPLLESLFEILNTGKQYHILPSLLASPTIQKTEDIKKKQKQFCIEWIQKHQFYISKKI